MTLRWENQCKEASGVRRGGKNKIRKKKSRGEDGKKTPSQVDEIACRQLQRSAALKTGELEVRRGSPGTLPLNRTSEAELTKNHHPSPTVVAVIGWEGVNAPKLGLGPWLVGAVGRLSLVPGHRSVAEAEQL